MADPDTSSQRTIRTTLIGLAVNIGLATAKLVAGMLGHSYALVADAVESFSDMLGSFVIWGGLKYSSRPADDNHPYGHGKAEALAALVVAGLLGAAGVGIAVKSVHEIITPHHTPAWWTLLVLVVVVAVKEGMFRFAARVAKEESSTAVETDAWHHRADAITSVAAFIGISIALYGDHRGYTGWEQADDWAAILASLVIMWNGVSLARGPLAELLDQKPGEIPERSEAIARGVPGVFHVEKVHARKAGARIFVDMHVQVTPTITVHEGHIISGKVKAAIRKELPEVAGVLIHIEPHEGAGCPEDKWSG